MSAALVQIVTGVASIVGAQAGRDIHFAKENNAAHRVLALVDDLLDSTSPLGYHTFCKLTALLGSQPSQLRAAALAIHALLLHCTDSRLVKVANCLLARMASDTIAE